MSSGDRRRGIYLLPNLFTTGGLFCGFYALVAATNGQYEAGAIAIYAAMIMDGLDGRVARMTNTQSDFGVQYDSLSDMVCFGLAPSFLMYKWCLSTLVNLGTSWGKAGWVVAFIFTACAALRLARFNTQVGVADKRFFQGLPSPPSAALLAGFVWVGIDLEIDPSNVSIIGLLLTLSAGILMVSNVRFHSFKEIAPKNRVPFMTSVIAILVIGFLVFGGAKALFLMALTYMVWGPVYTIVTLRKVRARRGTDEAHNESGNVETAGELQENPKVQVDSEK